MTSDQQSRICTNLALFKSANMRKRTQIIAFHSPRPDVICGIIEGDFKISQYESLYIVYSLRVRVLVYVPLRINKYYVAYIIYLMYTVALLFTPIDRSLTWIHYCDRLETVATHLTDFPSLLRPTRRLVVRTDEILVFLIRPNAYDVSCTH